MTTNESIFKSPSCDDSAVAPPVLSYQGSSPSFPDGWTGNQVFGLPQQKWTPFFCRRIIQIFGASLVYFIPFMASGLIDTHVNLAIGGIWAAGLVGFIALAFSSVLDETKSYRITLSDQGVLRSLRTMAAKEILILHPQIDRVAEVPNGIYIHCRQNPEPLFIYSELELFPILRARLNASYPIRIVRHPALYALKTHGPRSFLLFMLLTSIMASGKLDPGNLQIACLIIVYVCAIIQLIIAFRSSSWPRSRRISMAVVCIFAPLFASYMVCISPHYTFTSHHHYYPKLKI